MKTIVYIILTATLFPTFSQAEEVEGDPLIKMLSEAVPYDKLQKRKAGWFKPNHQKPFTGMIKGMHPNGQVRRLENVKDGKEVSVVEWYENGEKKFERRFDENGKWHGVITHWHPNGEKSSEQIREEGKVMSVTVWKPNGEKCPNTNITNGTGVWVRYNDDSTEKTRHSFKDGDRVSD